MAEVRQRKAPAATKETESKPAVTVTNSGSSKGLILGVGALALLAVGGYFYKPEGSVPGTPGFTLTEKELRSYTGEDTTKPIYLAISGTIYDVSASPRFYGPGGVYNHFAGRDASRGWVTECWDTEDQLVHNMEGVEEMYMPRYIDEVLQRAADGQKPNAIEMDMPGMEQLVPKAKDIMKMIGSIDEEELARRRVEDKVEAQKAVQARLDHWNGFFSENEKYKIAGKVIHSLQKPGTVHPPPCDAAMMKRPTKSGRLETAGKAMMEDYMKKTGKTPEDLQREVAAKQAAGGK